MKMIDSLIEAYINLPSIRRAIYHTLAIMLWLLIGPIMIKISPILFTLFVLGVGIILLAGTIISWIIVADE
jgi:hypothetical protein